jgi:hypothetical protein
MKVRKAITISPGSIMRRIFMYKYIRIVLSS